MPWVTKSSSETYAPAPPPRQYTRREKAQNWWHYHKWAVLGGAAALVLLAGVAWQTVFQVRPDVRIACVVRQELPQAAAAALETALQPFAADLNGDRRVVVQLDQYILDFDPAEDPMADPLESAARTAGITRLTADLSLRDGPYLVLTDAPEGLQRQLGALAYLDGTVPDPDAENFAAADWAQMALPWTACPVLAGLDLGSCEVVTPEGEPRTVRCQDLLAGLYIGRRAVFSEEQVEAAVPGGSLWQALTAGAETQEVAPR